MSYLMLIDLAWSGNKQLIWLNWGGKTAKHRSAPQTSGHASSRSRSISLHFLQGNKVHRRVHMPPEGSY